MSLVSLFLRLSVKAVPNLKQISTAASLQFKFTPVLCAEPLKKKKRIDPAIVKAREERKKKKIEKAIRKLEKTARTLKPIEECEVPLVIGDNPTLYKRPEIELTPEVLEQRVLLQKKWTKYKREQHLTDIQMLDRIAYSQQKALDELRSESEELYQEAIKMDLTLLPYKFEGPVNTPAEDDYSAPDGEYLDVSKKW